jgi:hypothetical protein
MAVEFGESHYNIPLPSYFIIKMASSKSEKTMK